MKISEFFNAWRFLLFPLLILLGSCATGPRVPTIWLEQVAREVVGASPRWQQAEPSDAGVRVRRGGVPIRAWRGMQLQHGDEVLTGLESAAVIAFRHGNTGAANGTITLDVDTHVRIGSLEVLFGRAWANLRGWFETSSESVVAGVEGTRFLFSVQRDRSVQIAVAEGVVNCRARGGEWSGLRLRDGEALFAGYRQSSAPVVTRVDPSFLRNAQNRAAEIGRSAASGWCCTGGQVQQGWENMCHGGQFFAQRAEAAQACRPEVSGWCCNSDGSVTGRTESECRGSFDRDHARAAHLCRIQNAPLGYCCRTINSSPARTTRADCSRPGWWSATQPPRNSCYREQ